MPRLTPGSSTAPLPPARKWGRFFWKKWERRSAGGEGGGGVGGGESRCVRVGPKVTGRPGCWVFFFFFFLHFQHFSSTRRLLPLPLSPDTAYKHVHGNHGLCESTPWSDGRPLVMPPSSQCTRATTLKERLQRTFVADQVRTCTQLEERRGSRQAQPPLSPSFQPTIIRTRYSVFCVAVRNSPVRLPRTLCRSHQATQEHETRRTSTVLGVL